MKKVLFSIRFSILKIIFILFIAAATPKGLYAKDAYKKRPNVLLIIADDLRPQLGCYGKSEIFSPNIDKLSNHGILFTNAFCQVPVCGASRASLFTSLRPTKNRFLSHKSRADKEAPGATDLIEHFKNNGYTTIASGKIFHSSDDNKDSWDDTYDTWGHFVLPENKKIKSIHKIGPAYECAEADDDEYPDGRFAKNAVENLRKHKNDTKPWFIAVGFHKPHLPFSCPKKYWDMYDENSIKLPDNYYPPENIPEQAVNKAGELNLHYGIPEEYPIPENIARTLIHGYYACVSYIDAQIGLILDELSALNLADNTIVILISDSGWHLGEHTIWSKHALYKTSLNVPLIIKAPGITGDKTCNALTEYIDIYPTLCDLAGLSKPKHLSGKSLMPLLINPQLNLKKAVFSRYRPGNTVITDRYLYTEFLTGKRMLFDHENDPEENINISEYPENAEIIKRLHSMIQQNIVASETPFVDAGKDRTVFLTDDSILLKAMVINDAPLKKEPLTILWQSINNSDKVVFDKPDSIDTMVSFTETGTYKLHLTVSDGKYTQSDEVIITVK